MGKVVCMRLFIGFLLFATIARGDQMHQYAEDEARFDAQLQSNPADVDAAYNAGQAYYNLGKMELALDRWRKAQKLAPGDFDIAKKILQATYGAGHTTEIASAHAAVVSLW